MTIDLSAWGRPFVLRDKAVKRESRLHEQPFDGQRDNRVGHSSARLRLV